MVKLNKGDKLYNTPYVVINTIGQGGFGIVYLVHHQSDRNVVRAAKVVAYDPKIASISKEEFLKECALEAKTSLRILQKPNLAKTYDVIYDEKNDLIIFIMEYVDGISLQKYIQKKGCIIPKEALNIFLKILQGVKDLHSFQDTIIHTDLKPSNIILSHDLRQAKILDFGSAIIVRKLGNDNTNKTIFEKNGVHGTIDYLYPDMKWSNVQPSVQYDFHPLGIILYEMIMGKRPFTGLDNKNYHMIAERYDLPNISSNPTIPNCLENIIYRLTVFKKAERKYQYQNVDEIIADVKNALEVLEHINGDVPLLKPVNTRTYQVARQYIIEDVKENQKFHQQWWAFIISGGVGLAFIIGFFITFMLLR